VTAGELSTPTYWLILTSFRGRVLAGDLVGACPHDGEIDALNLAPRR